jgi:heat shock protein HtpX
MKIAQVAKRVALFATVNILVVLTIMILLQVLGVGSRFPQGGLTSLAVFALLWGMVGSFVSLAISRLMARWAMGVQLVPPDTNDPVLRELVQTVHEQARMAGLPRMPQVGVYDSPDVNAFATGPTKARALVAVSTGLLQRMNRRQVEGVLAHEVSHIANGDMVTMTLLQGVINAIVIFLSRILAFAVSQALRSRDDRGGGGLQFLFIIVFQTVLSLLGAIVVAWFSRWREFRADAGGARLAGRENMIDALQGLRRMYEPELAAAEAQRAPSFQNFKISGGRRGFGALFASHPPLEERIARLQSGAL